MTIQNIIDNYKNKDPKFKTYTEDNIKWFNRIIPVKEIYEELKPTHPNLVIISKDANTTGSKHFALFESQKEVKKLLKSNNHLNEFYTDDHPIYFYADIDKGEKEGLVLPVTEKTKLNILINAINHINNLFVERFATFAAYNQISVWDSSREDKISFHVSFPFAFQTREDLKEFGKDLDFRKFSIDANPYLGTNQLRFPYQSKNGKTHRLLPYSGPLSELFKPKPTLFNLSIETPELCYKSPPKTTQQQKQNKPKIKRKGGHSWDLIEMLNRDLTPSPDYSLNNEIDFYLSCIPNHDIGQPSIVWLAIGMLLFNIDESINKWIKWSNKCEVYGDQTHECQKKWDSFHKNKDGYKIGTLIYLAHEYVPKENNKFHTKILKQVTDLNPGDFEFDQYESNHVKPYPLDNFDVVAECSPMGTGKTFQVKEYIKKTNPKRVLFMSPRIIFSRNIEGEFKDFDFKNYKDGGNLNSIDRLIMSVESIHKLETAEPFDLLVIDEVETILSAFMSETVFHSKKCSQVFETIAKTSKKVLLMDAFLSNKTIQFCKDLLSDKKIIIRNNTIKPTARKAFQTSLKGLIKKLLEFLKDGKKVVFASQSNNLAQNLVHDHRQFFQENNINVKFYHAKTDDALKYECVDARTAWENTQLLIYTPTITVGVNYDVPDNFDYLFIVGCDRSTTVRDTFQSSMRVRHLKKNELYFTHILSYEHDGFLSKEKVTENIKGKRDLVLDPVDSPEWLINVLVHSKLERNISNRFYADVFEHFLKQLNYKVTKLEKKVKAYQTLGNFVYDYEETPELNAHEFEKTIKKIETNKAETVDHLAVLKHMMHRDISITDKKKEKEIWASYCNDQFRQKFYRVYNHVFNDNLHDVDAVQCPESVFNYRLCTPYIYELCQLLGLSHAVDTKAESISEDIITKNKEKIEEIYQKCMKDMEIIEKGKYNKTQKKQKDEVLLVNKVNAILSRWCDSELKAGEVKRIRVNGNRIRVRSYYLENPIFKDLVPLMKDRKKPLCNNKNYFAEKLLN